MQVTELSPDAVKETLTRLRKVEGQVRALQRMIEEGRDCQEVLRQIAASTKALRRAGVTLAAVGLEHCLRDEHGETDPGALRRAFIELS